MTGTKMYWVVRIDWSLTDREFVLVDAPTAESAENFVRERGCNARYITAQLSQARIIN